MAGDFFRPWVESLPTPELTSVVGQDILGGRSNTPHKRQARFGVPKIHTVKNKKVSKKKSGKPSYSIESRQQEEAQLLQVQGPHEIGSAHQDEYQVDEINSETVDDPPQITQFIPIAHPEHDQISLSETFSYFMYLHNLSS